MIATTVWEEAPWIALCAMVVVTAKSAMEEAGSYVHVVKAQGRNKKE